MTESGWREEVARLLEHAAIALRTNNDRQSAVSFGTALAYLLKARAEGDRMACELIAQFEELSNENQTQRFTFVPGELDELRTRSKGE